MTLDSSQSIPARRLNGLIKLPKSLIGLLLLLGLLGSGYFTYQQFTGNVQQEARKRMKTVAVERTTLPITISANGTIAAKHSTNVSPKSAGRLKQLLVDEGDSVKAGQILAYMDDSNLQGQLLQAQGALIAAQATLKKTEAGNRQEDIAQAQATLTSAVATLQQSESDLNRYEMLYRSGAISAQSVSQYRTARNTSKSAVDKAQQVLKLSQVGNRQEDIETARAQVIQQEGNLKTIQAEIDDTIIRAPFSGVVTSKYADPGDFVTPTTAGSSVSSATSSSILSLASDYQVEAIVAETDIRQIKVGQSVTIAAAAYPDRTFKGKVAQIGAEASVSSNVTSVKVRVDLSDPERLLLPSMTVSVKFNAGSLSNVLVVPTVAIARQENGTGVQVVDANGQRQFVPIQTGATVKDKTEVRSGLQGNEQVLVSAPPNASDNKGSSSNKPGNPPGGMPGGMPPGGF